MAAPSSLDAFRSLGTGGDRRTSLERFADVLPGTKTTASADGWFPTTGSRSGYYRAADNSRLTEDFYVRMLSADRALRGALRPLRDRSRALCTNNPNVIGLLATLKDNIIGPDPCGIRLRATVRDPRTGELNSTLNRMIEDARERWARTPAFASANGRATHGDHQRMVITQIFTDGEFLARKLYGFDNPFGYSLQLLDPDLLDEKLNRPAGDGTNEIVMGVERDDYGRPLFYHLWNRHPDAVAGPPLARVPVPAAEIIHLFLEFRPGQTRGVPILAPILLTAHQVEKYLEAEIIMARIGASAGGFFKSTSESGAAYLERIPKPTADEDATDPDRLVMPIEPGLFRELPPGLDFQPWDPRSPHSEADRFVSLMNRTMSRAANVAYTTFSGDGREMNYGTLRGMTIAERDGYRGWQQFVGTWLVLPCHEDLLRMGSLFGAITLPGYDSADYCSCKLMPRGWQWIDPRNDALANEVAADRGWKSPQMICAEQGVDFFDVIDETAEAQAYAKEKGVNIAGQGGNPKLLTDPNMRDQQPGTPGAAVPLTPLDAARAAFRQPALELVSDDREAVAR